MYAFSFFVKKKKSEWVNRANQLKGGEYKKWRIKYEARREWQFYNNNIININKTF